MQNSMVVFTIDLDQKNIFAQIWFKKSKFPVKIEIWCQN